MQKIELNKFLLGDALRILKRMPDNYVDCIVTSPPYWGLRDYGVAGQIGLEDTPEKFIKNLVKIFMECYRVLKDTGTMWIVIGDSYNGGKVGRDDQQKFYDKTYGYKSKVIGTATKRQNVEGLKPKDLVGIPWMLAFALRKKGWYLRQEIIWHKPNPMPESVTDRCTKAHESVFLFSKSRQYYYDHKAIMEPCKNPDDDLQRISQQQNSNKSSPDLLKNGLRPRKSGNKERQPASERQVPAGNGGNQASHVPWEGEMANKRDVWTIPTVPFKEAHFATYPADLIVPMIKAGCPEAGIVLDPFSGSGTTMVVSQKLNRNCIAIEINPEYKSLSERRQHSEIGLFK